MKTNLLFGHYIKDNPNTVIFYREQFIDIVFPRNLNPVDSFTYFPTIIVRGDNAVIINSL